MLANVFPLLRDVEAAAIDGSPGEFKVSLQGSSRALRLGASALKLAYEFDGDRSCAEIAVSLRERGVALPEDDFVLALAQTLERVGYVRLADGPWSAGVQAPPSSLESVNPLRHHCTGCGRSCEGHLIGPLEPAFLERVSSIVSELSAVYSDLIGCDVVVPLEGGRRGMRLALADHDRCVFLGEDRLCRIHKHLGAAAKPLICRTFPVQMVKTEGGVRVGVLRCFDSHKSYVSDTPEQSPGEITGLNANEFMAVDRRGLNPHDPGNLLPAILPGTMAGRTYVLEQRVMAMLGQEATTATQLLVFFLEVGAGKPLPVDSEGLLLKPIVVEVLLRHLKGFAERLSEQKGALYQAAGSETLYGSFYSLCRALSALDVEDVVPLTKAQRDYGFYLLREWFFTRYWQKQGSFEEGGLTMLLGVLSASWSDPVKGGDDVSDQFGHHLGAWSRLMSEVEPRGLLMGDGRLEQIQHELVGAFSA